MPEVFLLPAHMAYMGHTCAREYTGKTHVCTYTHVFWNLKVEIVSYWDLKEQKGIGNHIVFD